MGNPKTLCYAISPCPWIDDHAAAIAGLYDGFYVQCGSWDRGVAANIGVGNEPAANADWLPRARRNVDSLRRHGITENLIAVSFGGGDPWPTAETLLSDDQTAKFARYFGALGMAARECGFIGASIDLEYPFPRYELDHPQYAYDGYTPGDLMAAAYRQGRAATAAFLDAYPGAVVFLLPGGIRTRPLERQFMLAIIDEMTDRDAPGGCHLASEYSYREHDLVTQASVPRFDEARMGVFATDSALAYWRRRCTVAPGVWAMHQVESESSDYPVKPWPGDMTERRDILRVLRPLAKRYLWTYSSYATWHVPADGEDRGIGGRYPDFPGAAEAIGLWHEVLRDDARYDELPDADPRMLRLFAAIREFDAGGMSPPALCDAFGTPGSWWVLGPLANPHATPKRTADEALANPIDARQVYCGRDGAVRWFAWPSHDPRGLVNTRSVFDFMAADDMSFHLVAWAYSDVERDVVLNVGWHDGLVLRLGDKVVLDRPDYEPVPHTGFVRDRSQFDERISAVLPAGWTRIAATVIVAKQAWRFAFRITDPDGYPFDGMRFELEPRGKKVYR